MLPKECLDIIYDYTPSKYRILIHKNILDLIISFLSIKIRMMLNKYNYKLIENKIIINRCDKFFIDIFKAQSSITIYKWVLREKTQLLFKNKKYYFGNNVFKNLYSLLDFLCIQNNNSELRNYLRSIDENKKLIKNKHKNKMYKNII